MQTTPESLSTLPLLLDTSAVLLPKIIFPYSSLTYPKERMLFTLEYINYYMYVLLAAFFSRMHKVSAILEGEKKKGGITATKYSQFAPS